MDEDSDLRIIEKPYENVGEKIDWINNLTDYGDFVSRVFWNQQWSITTCSVKTGIDGATSVMENKTMVKNMFWECYDHLLHYSIKGIQFEKNDSSDVFLACVWVDQENFGMKIWLSVQESKKFHEILRARTWKIDIWYHGTDKKWREYEVRIWWQNRISLFSTFKNNDLSENWYITPFSRRNILEDFSGTKFLTESEEITEVLKMVLQNSAFEYMQLNEKKWKMVQEKILSLDLNKDNSEKILQSIIEGDLKKENLRIVQSDSLSSTGNDDIKMKGLGIIETMKMNRKIQNWLNGKFISPRSKEFDVLSETIKILPEEKKGIINPVRQENNYRIVGTEMVMDISKISYWKKKNKSVSWDAILMGNRDSTDFRILENTKYNTKIERSKSYAESIELLTKWLRLRKIAISKSLPQKVRISAGKEMAKIGERLSIVATGLWGLVVTPEIVNEYEKLLTSGLIEAESQEKAIIEQLSVSILAMSNHFVSGKNLSRFWPGYDFVSMKDKIIGSTNSKKLNIFSEFVEKVREVGFTEKEYAAFNLSNDEGNGAYHTPPEVMSLFSPFFDSSKRKYVVTDLSAGKWTLLSAFDGSFKISNDIDPLSQMILSINCWFDTRRIIRGTEEEILSEINDPSWVVFGKNIVDVFGSKFKTDLLLMNPPYMKTAVNSRDKKSDIKEVGIKLSNGTVSISELSLYWFTDNVFDGWYILSINSARSLGSLEKRRKIDATDVLVPLIRYGINWDPFEREGVKLAPISIEWSRTYSFDGESISKKNDYAEFFVTIFQRVKEADAEKFPQEIPTILIHSKDISAFKMGDFPEMQESLLISKSYHESKFLERFKKEVNNESQRNHEVFKEAKRSVLSMEKQWNKNIRVSWDTYQEKEYADFMSESIVRSLPAKELIKFIEKYSGAFFDWVKFSGPTKPIDFWSKDMESVVFPLSIISMGNKKLRILVHRFLSWTDSSESEKILRKIELNAKNTKKFIKENGSKVKKRHSLILSKSKISNFSGFSEWKVIISESDAESNDILGIIKDSGSIQRKIEKIIPDEETLHLLDSISVKTFSQVLESLEKNDVAILFEASGTIEEYERISDSVEDEEIQKQSWKELESMKENIQIASSYISSPENFEKWIELAAPNEIITLIRGEDDNKDTEKQEFRCFFDENSNFAATINWDKRSEYNSRLDKIITSFKKNKTNLVESPLLSVYDDGAKKEIQSRFLSVTSAVSGTVELLWYERYRVIREVERARSTEKDITDERIDEIRSSVDFMNFVVANMDDTDRFVVVSSLLNNHNESKEEFTKYVSSAFIETKILEAVDTDRLWGMIQERKSYFETPAGRYFAKRIASEISGKQDFSGFMTKTFSNIETDVIKRSGNSVFKKDYLEFREKISKMARSKRELEFSKKFAELITWSEVLRQKDPYTKDLLSITPIREYVESTFSELDEEEIKEAVLSNKEILLSAKKWVKSELEFYENETPIPGGEKLLPTHAQSRALYNFYKYGEKHKSCKIMLSQSEVGTWKTFTMPFYEMIVGKFGKEKSDTIVVTEANLVANTRKSLIENGISPSDIFEAKLSSIDDVKSILSKIWKGGTGKYVIFSSTGIGLSETLNIKNFVSWLKRKSWKLNMFADEATFLKNTESWAYSSFMKMFIALRSSNKLSFANFMTATPVNNDNGDFLWLLSLMDNSWKMEYVKETCLKNWISDENDIAVAFKLFSSVSKSGGFSRRSIKIEKHDEGKKPRQFFYSIPEIIYWLEFIRTWRMHSMNSFDPEMVIEIPSVFDEEVMQKVTLKNFYWDMGIGISSITEDEYIDGAYREESCIMMKGSDEKVRENMISALWGIQTVNFDRNLNSVGIWNSESFVSKTFVSVSPNIAEAYVIKAFLKKAEKTARFRKLLQANSKHKKSSDQFSEIIRNELKKVSANVIAESIQEAWYEPFSITSEEIKEKKRVGFREVEVSKTVYSMEFDESTIRKAFETKSDGGFLFQNKAFDAFFANVAIEEYGEWVIAKSKFESLPETEKRARAKESDIMNESLSRGLSRIAQYLQMQISWSSELDTTIVLTKIADKFLELGGKSFMRTFLNDKNYFVESLSSSVEWEKTPIQTWTLSSFRKEWEGMWFTERKLVMRVLEDFGSPLCASFVDMWVDLLIDDLKNSGKVIEISEWGKNALREQIVTKGNTISSLLKKIAIENSKNNENSFISASFVSTVRNIDTAIHAEGVKTFRIIGSEVPTSKWKLDLVTKFDAIDDGMGKVLVATTKSVEKGLSIFHCSKWYTTIGDENAGAIVQRAGRFRAIMKSQKIALLERYEKTDSLKEKESIKKLLSDKKEFFVLSNRISEPILRTGHQKQSLLSVVNASTLWKGMESFQMRKMDKSELWKTFSVSHVETYVNGYIESVAKKFFEKMGDGPINDQFIMEQVVENINSVIDTNLASIRELWQSKRVPSENEILEMMKELNITKYKEPSVEVFNTFP